MFLASGGSPIFGDCASTGSAASAATAAAPAVKPRTVRCILLPPWGVFLSLPCKGEGGPPSVARRVGWGPPPGLASLGHPPPLRATVSTHLTIPSRRLRSNP